jgi:hypothetical protein
MDLEKNASIKVASFLTFSHILQAIEERIIGAPDIGDMMRDYREKYGVNVGK